MNFDLISYQKVNFSSDALIFYNHLMVYSHKKYNKLSL